MKDEILRLWSEGLTYTEIQKRTGASKGTIAYHCGVGQKEKTLDRQRDRRGKVARFLQELKQSTPCADCRESYPYWVMQFDHLSDKLFELKNRTQRTLDEVKAEVAKCEIVCANCHATRTYSRSVSTGSNALDVSSLY